MVRNRTLRRIDTVERRFAVTPAPRFASKGMRATDEHTPSRRSTIEVKPTVMLFRLLCSPKV